MVIKTDRGSLTKELKAAVKDVRFFLYAPGKKPKDSVLIVSKKPIPASERKKAKTKTGAAKIYAGKCFKEGPDFVFETDRNTPETFAKVLKETIKSLSDFKPPKLAARLAPELAGKVVDALTEEKEKVPKLPDAEELKLGDGFEKAGLKPPSFGTEDSDDPVTQSLKDTERDLKKAKEYVDYIKKALEYVEKSGDATGIKSVSKVSKQLGAATKRVSGVLKKAGDQLGDAKKIWDWVEAMRTFVDASNDLDVESRDTFKYWGKTLERLFDTSTKLYDWKGAANKAAAGSAAAGMTFFVAAYVGSMLYIGIKTLNQGITNIDAYFDRMHRVIRESEFDARGGPPPGVEKPEYPGDYVSPEEEEKRREEQREWDREKMEETKRKHERYDLTQEFDEKVFPKLYLKIRKDIHDAILDDIEKEKAGALIWWDAFMTENTVVTDELQDPDDLGPLVGGVAIDPAKKKVSLAEATQEIVEFRGQMPPCPHFEKRYKKTLENYIRQNSGK